MAKSASIGILGRSTRYRSQARGSPEVVSRYDHNVVLRIENKKNVMKFRLCEIRFCLLYVVSSVDMDLQRPSIISAAFR